MYGSNFYESDVTWVGFLRLRLSGLPQCDVLISIKTIEIVAILKVLVSIIDVIIDPCYLTHLRFGVIRSKFRQKSLQNKKIHFR